MSARRLHGNRLATALIVAVLTVGVLATGELVGLEPPAWPSLHSFLSLSLHEAPGHHAAAGGE